jgi:hypothetical protein
MITMKSSNRPAPAYQEYASDILANRTYRAMTLAQRGLWDTIRKECWVNGSVPSSIPELAKYLGLDMNEVTKLMDSKLMACFEKNNADLTCPEIEAYRSKIELQRQSMSNGGRNGGRKTQANRRKEGEATLEGEVKALNRDESNRDELNGEESSKDNIGIHEHSAWLDEFQNSKSPNRSFYLMNSKGY